MSTLTKLLAAEAAERDAMAASQPPLPVLGPVETGVAWGADEHAKAAGVSLGRALKTLVTPLTFTVEGLTRFEDTFQATVLTAFGRVPRREYPGMVHDILFKGRKIDGRTFTELAFGHSFAQQLERMSVIPGWTKKVAGAEGVMMNRPRISFADVFGLAEEMFVSPFALVATMPKAALAATRLDKAMDLMAWPMNQSLRLAGKAVFSPETTWGAFLLRLRDPHAVLPKDLADRLALDAKYIEDASVGWRKTLTTLYERHGLGVNLVGRLMGKSRNPGIRPHMVYHHLFDKAQRLRPEEQAFAEDELNQVIHPLLDKLAAVKGPNRLTATLSRP